MPGAKTVIKIDGDKLRRELEKRNLTQQAASRELGFGGNFISNAARRGSVSKSAMKSIELAFNISPEDIAPAEPAPLPQTLQPQQIEMEMPAGLTYQEVTQAVAEGIRAAFEALFEEYAIYKVGGVQTVRKRAEKEPEHDVLR